LEKLNIGVVGIGKLGRYHGQNLLQIPSVNLVGVHDIDKDRGGRVAEELGVEFYQNYLTLLQNVDAVSIAVPTINHLEISRQALNLKKPVFIEKPIAATLKEAEELVLLAEEQKVQMQIGHVERFNPAFRELDRNLLNPKFIETHRLASFDPRGTDVAVVLDLMIHDIDLTLSIVDNPIKRIDANGVSVISKSEDIANARIQFENGCVANLTASRISLKKMRKMRLFQEDMYISLDLLIGLAEVYQLKALPKDEQVQSPISWGMIEKEGVRKQIAYNKLQSEEENALKLELESFVDSVLHDQAPIVSGKDGLKALKVAYSVLEEIKKNKKLLNS